MTGEITENSGREATFDATSLFAGPGESTCVSKKSGLGHDPARSDHKLVAGAPDNGAVHLRFTVSDLIMVGSPFLSRL